MPIQVRAATPDDAKALVGVLRAAVEALPGTDYPARERATWSTCVTDDEMQEGLQASDTETVVAEVDTEIVGFATREGNLVRAVYVHPQSQGRGIGSDLLRVVEAAARANGMDRLAVSASLNSVGFYTTHGYERVGESHVELGDKLELRVVDLAKELGR